MFGLGGKARVLTSNTRFINHELPQSKLTTPLKGDSSLAQVYLGYLKKL
jgi:hypothetical protein